jgi:nuclear pore complex protein Nup133
MEEIGDGPHEDVMRAFFRYHVADIAKLLKKVLDIVQASSMAANSTLPHILLEANRVVIVSSLSLAPFGIMCSLRNRLSFSLHSSIELIILMFTESTFP